MKRNGEKTVVCPGRGLGHAKCSVRRRPGQTLEFESVATEAVVSRLTKTFGDSKTNS